MTNPEPAETTAGTGDPVPARPFPTGPLPPDEGIETFARQVIRANQSDFLRAARGQRFAFATMKWMFLLVFLIALGAMIAAIRIATDVPETGYTAALLVGLTIWAHRAFRTHIIMKVG